MNRTFNHGFRGTSEAISSIYEKIERVEDPYETQDSSMFVVDLPLRINSVNVNLNYKFTIDRKKFYAAL